MLIGVFKSNQKIVNLLIVVLTAVLLVTAFFVHLQTEFNHLLSTNIKWLDILISVVLISGQAIYLNIIVNEYKLVKNSSHLTSLMLVLLNSCCLFFLNLNQVVIANSFILLAFHQMLRMYNLKNNYAIVFNASFLIALASLFYAPTIFFFFLLWITLLYTATPKWRDFIISLLGLSVPIVYYVAYKFILGDLSEMNIDKHFYTIFDIHWNEISLLTKAVFGILSIIILFSFLSLVTTINASVVRVRKMLVIVILMVIIGLGTLFLNKMDYFATWLVITIPVAIIVANFFQNIRKGWLAELLFLVLLVGLVWGYFS